VKAVCGLAEFCVRKIRLPGPATFCHDHVGPPVVEADRVKSLATDGFCPGGKWISGKAPEGPLSTMERLSMCTTELPLLFNDAIITPANTVSGASGILRTGPSWNQLLPSVERKQVKSSPLRVRRSQYGAAWFAVPLLSVVVEPLVVRRLCHGRPLSGVAHMKALVAPASVEARTITPALAHGSVRSWPATLAVRRASPE
jgi:hypothetical protein